MGTPTVASLCAVLGADLAPVAGFAAPPTPITGVHISELLEPGPYLSGGELLLTTGLLLPDDAAGCRTYVDHLVTTDVAALAIGLGPVHEQVPETLATACREADLALLTVPEPTPFLTISSAYWAQRSRSSEQRLAETVAANQSLVDAAAAPDPASAILRRLAHILGGWAALLTTRGAVDLIHPPTMDEDVEELQAQVRRLELAGVHSSASFGTAEHVVVVHPLAIGGRVVGYLAAGCPQQLDAGRRRAVLTAVGLLSLDAIRDRRAESARSATRRCVATLVDLGHAPQARDLAARMGAPVPGREVVVLALRGRESEALQQVVEQWCSAALVVPVDRTTAWALVPHDHPAVTGLEAALSESHPEVSLVVSGPVAAEWVGPIGTRLRRRLDTVAPGGVVRWGSGPDGDATAQAVEGFVGSAGEEVLAALVAYLRHRGQWERAAGELGVHRNTLRYRVARAREQLGLDVDDPDVFAHVWLALRARGLA